MHVLPCHPCETAILSPLAYQIPVCRGADSFSCSLIPGHQTSDFLGSCPLLGLDLINLKARTLWMGRTNIPKKSQGILVTCFGSQIAVGTESFSIVGVCGGGGCLISVHTV